MSIDLHVYVGWYIECPNIPTVPDYEHLFPDELFFRAIDEGGSEEINHKHIYLPNQDCDGCYSLSKYSAGGIDEFNNNEKSVPQMFLSVYGLLNNYYNGACSIKYGIVRYWR